MILHLTGLAQLPVGGALALALDVEARLTGLTITVASAGGSPLIDRLGYRS